MDGTGYPEGCAARRSRWRAASPPSATSSTQRSSDRTYRPALSLDETFDVIVNGRCHHFDAELADVFLEAEAEVRAIARNSQLPGAPPQFARRVRGTALRPR